MSRSRDTTEYGGSKQKKYWKHLDSRGRVVIKVNKSNINHIQIEDHHLALEDNSEGSLVKKLGQGLENGKISNHYGRKLESTSTIGHNRQQPSNRNW